MPLSIEAIDEQNIVVGTTDYELAIDIGGDPDSAEVEGLQEGFYQDWDAANDRIFIRSEEVTRIIADAEWAVRAKKSGESDVTSTILYNVVPATPIITDPGAQTLYRGIPFRNMIQVANAPTIVRGESPIVALKSTPVVNEDGDTLIETAGTLPMDARLAFDSFDTEYHAENEGGSDDITVAFTVEDTAIYVAAIRNNLIKVFDTSNSNAQVGSDINLGSAGFWINIAMSESLVAGSDRTNGTIKVFDTSNSNAQVGNDIDFGSASYSFTPIVMSGSLVAVVGGSVSFGRLSIFDTSNGNAQVGSDIDLGAGARDVAMSGSLVAALNNSSTDVIKVFDTSNGNAQVGSDIDLGQVNSAAIAMAGSLVAVLDNGNDVIKVFDTSNGNAQVGSDINFEDGSLEYSIAMSGSLVAAISDTNDVIKVFDTSNGNAQVGSDINLGSGTWPAIAMAGSLVAALDESGTIKVFDTSNSNAQVGSDINLGSGTWREISMTIAPV